MPKGVPGSKAPHGTPSRYSGHACRCDACRTAWTEYVRARNGQMSRQEWRESVEPAHGTESRSKRCRCESCKAAAAAARQVRRLRDPDQREKQAEQKRAWRSRRRAKGLPA